MEGMASVCDLGKRFHILCYNILESTIKVRRLNSINNPILLSGCDLSNSKSVINNR